MKKGSLSESWKYIDSGFCRGQYNMDYDESLALDLLDRDGPRVLRLYRWQPWAISLGYHQNEAEVDVARCSTDGIEVVRRPTGGRAILHAEELTYSVVMSVDDRGVLEVYNDISRALLQGLKLFGVEAEHQRSQPGGRRGSSQASSIPCFSSSARYEIGWKGKKLVGSAQRRYSRDDRAVVLQHGSILCGPAHLDLARYLRVKEPNLKAEIRKDLEEKTMCLQDAMGGEIDQNVLADCVRRGFEAAWGITFCGQDMAAESGVAYG